MLATRQHGVVARWQLAALGLSSDSVDRRLKAGRLLALYRGVYAVGHRNLTRKGRWMAAVLACGPDAVLSHRAAIALWELRPPSDGRVDVTVATRGRASRRSIRVHCVRSLHPDDRTEKDGIPVTSVHRALLDYAAVAPPQQLRHAIEAAERLQLFDLVTLNRLLARSSGRCGIKAVNTVLAEIQGPVPWTRSELERRALAFIRDAGLPEPQVNVIVHGEEVDLYWPGNPPLVVELDSWEFHKGRTEFENDRRRDTKMQRHGCRTMRITQWRIERSPRELLDDLSALIPDDAYKPPAGRTGNPRFRRS